ncbi:MAG TPA: DsrE/DsrF/DrsH-like family protein [Candidatus Thermoplasmatota archaeon]|nr:DsrE/DsrF/DrsH-like family protein [Candidatus Thermoplasmatota archaeon]
MVEKKAMTILLHSGDLDKAIAAFIIATGAAAKGIQTTMFFTFWGLKVIQQGGAQSAKLSQMNMGGLGKMMIKRKMKKKNVASLQELIKDAGELGVRLIACEMTTDLMNVPKESLLPEVKEIGGVGTFLDAVTQSDSHFVF